MEDKKSIKVSLGTVICLFIIFILIVALVGMYFYYNYFRKTDEGVKTENTVTNVSKIDNANINENKSDKSEENGTQINENGSKNEDITNGFVKSFGNGYSKIFVKTDNTIFFYDHTTSQYIQIKDENGSKVKIKDAFVQWSTINNNLVEENGGEDRLFVVTEDDKLIYFDGYEHVTAKKYKDANNKTVKLLTEEKQYDEYGGHRINMNVTFTDGSKLLLKDAQRSFFN